MLRKRMLFLSLAVVGLVGCNQHSASPPQPKKKAIAAGEIGSRLPDFSVKDLQGHEISSADLRGKVVLIDFWATWCQPCKKEMPGYQKLVDRYGSRRICCHRIQIRHHDGHGRPSPICKENRRSLSAGGRVGRRETEVWRHRRIADHNALRPPGNTPQKGHRL